MGQFTYEIRKLPAGAGWWLRLLDGGNEVAGRAVHAFDASPAHVDTWWASLGENERHFWIREAGTVRLDSVYRAFRNAQAWLDARALATAWVRSREAALAAEPDIPAVASTMQSNAAFLPHALESRTVASTTY